MSEQNSQSNPDRPEPIGGQRAAKPEPPARLVESGVCDRCRYDLKNLPEIGTCPECGTPYTPQTIRPVMHLPGALELTLMFGWPIFLMIVFVVPSMMARDSALGCMALVMIAAIPINTGAMILAMMSRLTPPQWRGKPFHKRMRLLGTWAVVTFYLVSITPLFVFGGCVVIVLMMLGTMH